MSIELNDMVKVLGLTEEQASKMNEVQEAFNKVYQNEIEAEKTGLLNKNQELLEKLRSAKEKMIPEDFDMDGYKDYVENKDKILEEKRKAEEEKLIATQNWDKLKNDMTNKHEQTINELTLNKDNEINHLRSALDSTIIENESLKAIEEAKGNQTLLMPHIKNNIQTYLDESTGQYKTRVVDAAGNQRMNTETGNPYQIKDLISELQADERFAGAFPTMNKGSNTSVNVGGTNYTSANNPFDKNSKAYSITAQSKLRRENPTLAKTLKEAADNLG